MMKILYAGTPDFAVRPLQALIEAGFDVVGVITQTDKPQGRKNILTPPPVKVAALALSLPVVQFEKIKTEISALQTFQADVLVTCAYGQILSQEVLDVFPKGVWNIHAGLLPKYRGASPIQSSILAGERETGVCIMKTELGLDCGDILQIARTEIGLEETYGELSDRLSAIAAEAIVQAVGTIKEGNFTLQKQATFGVGVVKKIDKEQAKMDFSQSAKELVDLVRAFNPAPVAYATLEGVKINVYRAKIGEMQEEYATAKLGEIVCDSPKKGLLVRCGDGVVKLTELQPAGGKKMDAAAFLNGRKAQKGQVFVW
ncbi:MAG: methionyl-tRNA formyltransferase [Clostridia bacterium]|nr:methionyl-tRNA formyltransferase [Clostridia bacterium]